MKIAAIRSFTTSAAARRTIRYSQEVQRALNNQSAVVALESTIISHGMPYPQNLETAIQVEDIVRTQGATPATIALMDGDLCIGLEHEQLKRLAQDGLSATKCSRRDLARVMAKKDLGATTVSGTMVASELAGIDVFVTGGIGGVHRGVEHTMDVSADLSELGRTPVVVVCAGVKSILDIPRTLEYLETQGVAVMCWQTDCFPAFFTVDSGEKAPMRVDNAAEVADWIDANKLLNLKTGAIVAVPNPEPADTTLLNNALDTALKEVKDQNVQGKEATPYLLKRVNELTGGDSLRSNIALVCNNARVGAQIAVANASNMTRQRRSFSTSAQINYVAPTIADMRSPPPLVVGGATIDMIARADNNVQSGTSNLGTVQQTHGGVARNITECLGRYGTRPRFASVAGEDDAGHAILNALREVDVDVSSVTRLKGERTAVYNALLDGRGDLVAAVADMDIMNHLDANFVASLEQLCEAQTEGLIIVDGNVSQEAMAALGNRTNQNMSVWFEPTSVVKATRVLDALGSIELMSPNVDELVEISRALNVDMEVDREMDVNIEEVKQLGKAVVKKMVHMAMALGQTDVERWVVVTMGDQGCILCRGAGKDSAVDVVLSSNHLLPDTVFNDMENCTGAGDCQLATMAAVRHQWGHSITMSNAVSIGMAAASLTIQSPRPVSTKLDRAWLQQKVEKCSA